MPSRRIFLKTTTGLAAASLLNSSASLSGEENPGSAQTIPDTLDLAEHGRLALNGILGSLNPELDFESVFLHILDVHPAYMLHWSTMLSGVMPKYVEALPMLRTMSGSSEEMDLQNGFMDAMLKNASEDGLVYDRATEKRPWNVGVYYGRPDWNEDYASMAGNGRMLAGFTYWYGMTGDDVWRERAKKTAERLLELAIVEGDNAWYPNPGCGNDYSYPRVSGWTKKDPPAGPNEGYEHFAVLFSESQHLRGFARHYRETGDDRFLELSKKFVNFLSDPKFWGGVHDSGLHSALERGRFQGHFHASLGALRAFLDYAIVANDVELKMRVRDGYEWGRQMGIHRVGIFPNTYEMTEGCTIGDMVGLAVALCDAGLGDYWDDIEMYARNGLLEAQSTDPSELQRVSEEGKHRPPEADWGGHFDTRFGAANKGVLPGQEIHERVLERTIGTFGHLCGCRYLIPQMMSCCTANCSQGLYAAWEGILRSDGTTAEVNMWLNRRSPWLDVASFLPYEGRLELRNKGLRTISIRKPAWVSRTELRCMMNGADVEGRWRGNRLVLEGLKGDEKIVLLAPLEKESSTHTLVNLNSPDDSKEEYRCVFKGGTALSVERTVSGRAPGDPYYGDFNWYRLFRREAMNAAETPMTNQPDYVPPKKIVKWTLA